MCIRDSYKNNTKVGVATVVISGKGAYTGSVTKKFKINPKSVALFSLKARKKAVQVKWKKSSMKVSGYQVSYSTSKTVSYTHLDVYKRQLKRYASWVQNIVRQFGPYPLWALEI